MFRKILSSLIFIIYILTMSSGQSVFAEEKNKSAQTESVDDKKTPSDDTEEKDSSDDSEKEDTDDKEEKDKDNKDKKDKEDKKDEKPKEYLPHSKYMLAVDMKSGLFTYEKNSDESFKPGGLVKILTAITVLENVKDINKKVTVPEGILEDYDYDCGNIGLRYGEILSVRTLLEAMLIYDAGDCALALAHTTAESYEKFIALMNDTAKKAGAKKTVFSNPAGNDTKAQNSTLRDMYLITAYALKNKTFSQIVSTDRIEIAPTNKYPQSRILFSTNQFLTTYYSLDHKSEYVKGVKSYYNSENDCGVIALYQDSADSYLLLCAGSDRIEDNNYSYNDAKFILNYSKQNYKQTVLVRNEEIISELKLPNGKQSDHVLAVSNGTIQMKLPISYKQSDIRIETDIKEKIMAPVKKGEKLGTATVYYGENKCGTVDLIAYSDIGHSTSNLIKYWMSIVLNSTYFKIIIITLLALFIFKTIKLNRKKRKN